MSADAARAFAEDLCVRLRGYRFLFDHEDRLQDGIARALAELGVPFERERRLGKAGRVDFYFAAVRLALEVKVDGSPAAVLRQLIGYAGHDDVAGLMLVTSRARLGSVPETLAGKPAVVLYLRGNGV